MKRPARNNKKSATKTEHDPVVRIAGRETIECVDAVQADLRRLLEAGHDPVVNLSDVRNCSIATLQLFCSAALTAADAGRELSFSAPGAETKAAIRAAGLQHFAPFQSLMQGGNDLIQGAGEA